MGDLAIRGYSSADPSRWPVVDDFASQQAGVENAAQHIKNQERLRYYQDTMQKHDGFVDTTLDTRPKLTAPDQNSTAETSEQLIAAMNELVERIKNGDSNQGVPIDTDPSKSDVIFFRLMMEGMARQKSSKEESGEVARASVMKNQEIQKALQKELHKLQEELAEYSKKSQALWWVDTILTGASILGLIGSIVATVITAGAALPTAIAAFTAVASIAKGGSGFVKGYYDKKTNENTGEVFLVKEQRSRCHKKIEKHLHEMKDLVDYMSSHWKSLKEIQKNKRDAVSFR